jgi:hypothetical protein
MNLFRDRNNSRFSSSSSRYEEFLPSYRNPSFSSYIYASTLSHALPRDTIEKDRQAIRRYDGEIKDKVPPLPVEGVYFADSDSDTSSRSRGSINPKEMSGPDQRGQKRYQSPTVSAKHRENSPRRDILFTRRGTRVPVKSALHKGRYESDDDAAYRSIALAQDAKQKQINRKRQQKGRKTLEEFVQEREYLSHLSSDGYNNSPIPWNRNFQKRSEDGQASGQQLELMTTTHGEKNTLEKMTSQLGSTAIAQMYISTSPHQGDFNSHRAHLAKVNNNLSPYNVMFHAGTRARTIGHIPHS